MELKRVQEILSNHEVFGTNQYPLEDYKTAAQEILQQLSLGMIIDEYELDELIYDVCSTTGAEDYEDVACQIWDEWESE